MHARRRGFDFTALSGQQADILEPALHACTFPTGRIKRRAGVDVPVAVSDLSRFAAALDAYGHGHASRRPGEHAHLLGEPVRPGDPVIRRAPLGLYWLPNGDYPAGRIEIGATAMVTPDLAREVLLAEAAHCVDLVTMSESQRTRISGLFDYVGSSDVKPAGWFEELGETSYFAWRGEAFMSLWAAAFAPTLPRPLQARQPWEWSFDSLDVLRVRQILRRPSS